MDIAAEKLITDLISQHRPHDGFLGEEGASSEGTSGIRWVVDPLDGTVNYLYGLPTWAVSIAAEQNGETVVGVVAAPMRGETYSAVRGRGARATGAWVGERRLACRPSPPLDQALVSTGFNYVTEVKVHQAEVAHRLIPCCATSGAAVRRPSTCATSPRAASTATTSAVCTPGTSRRAT